MSDSRPQGLMNGAGKVMVGIYDFSYGPYALGDALTWQMNLGVLPPNMAAMPLTSIWWFDP